MTDVRRVLAAALLLAASGCCWEIQRTDACVVGEWCVLQTTVESCQPELDVVHVCQGMLREDESCADLGFTIRCADDRWVAPGSSCG